ncbi:Rap1a/Tai family immunity protein [Methylobacterium sp. NEAU K]|uniref:Rap1a/Tai family immunity protein n=1 Tax=Methylobacterium sp. NEAU K TaxID=3064946 RepID=UPI0027344065|nr:Rap1a/Tai family immunity protein [Methylobacterium sp. NEAU K]MDP4003282.1 Rap1a/Tai family immunity protein [Methylobacterium sp. NEAU K]
MIAGSRNHPLVIAGLLAPFLAAAIPEADAADCATKSCLPNKPGPTSAEPGKQPAGPVDIRERRTADLYRACLAEQGEASGWCSAYLMGIADTLTAFGNGGDRGGLCDVDYSIEQLSDTFLTWVRAHDTMLQLDMLAGATLAFRQRWPCR